MPEAVASFAETLSCTDASDEVLAALLKSSSHRTTLRLSPSNITLAVLQWTTIFSMVRSGFTALVIANRRVIPVLALTACGITEEYAKQLATQYSTERARILEDPVHFIQDRWYDNEEPLQYATTSK